MEHRTAAGGRMDADAYRPILAALPVPVVLVEAHGAHRVLLVNDAFAARLGRPDGAGEGDALEAVVPADLSVAVAGGGPGRLGEVLDDLLAAPEPVAREARLRHERGEGPAVVWRLSLSPVRDADGVVAGVLLVFADGDGDGAVDTGSLPARDEALRDLAVGLTADKPAARIHADMARAAAATVGAGRAAILLDEGGEAFSVAATTPGAGLPGRDTLLEASAGVWQVAIGRTRTHWDGTGDPPLPFAGEPGGSGS